MDRRTDQLVLFMLCISLLAGSCQAACSGDPAVVENGFWECDGTADGGMCTATCNAGYTSYPPPIARCVGTTWQNPMGRCNPVCEGGPTPSDLTDGTWFANCTDSIRVGGYCQGECNPGFLGKPKIMCISGSRGFDKGTMLGRCVQAQAVCTGVPGARLVDGHFPRSCADTPAGQVCTGVCNRERGGPVPPTVRCIADPSVPVYGARWASDAEGDCRRVCTGLPDAGPLGGTADWPATCEGTVFGGRCRAKCKDGLYGNPTVLCWNGWSSFVVGACKDKPVCSSLPSMPLTNGAWPTSCLDTAVNGSCTGVCNAGYGGAIKPSVQCLDANGEINWASSTRVGLCRKVCNGLPDPALLGEAGYWPEECDGKVPVNGRCTAKCNTGYGSPTVTCGNNGWETSVIGACRTKPTCNRPPTATITNGGWYSSCIDTEFNGTCLGWCNPSYGGPVPPSARCVDDGTGKGVWETTGASTACKKACPGLPEASLLGGQGVWPQDCGGNRITVGKRCTAKCKSGYGAPSIMCYNDGWNSAITGACRPAPVCPALPTIRIVNGQWPQSCTDTVVNGTCTAVCNNAYGGPALPAVKCVDRNGQGVWDDSSVQGACNKICPGLPSPTLLGQGGSWDANCNNRVNTRGICTGKCTATGGVPGIAKTECNNDGWAMYLTQTCTPCGGTGQPACPPEPQPVTPSPSPLPPSPSPTPSPAPANISSPSPAPAPTNNTSPSPSPLPPSPSPAPTNISSPSPAPAPTNNTSPSPNPLPPSPSPGPLPINTSSPSPTPLPSPSPTPSPTPSPSPANNTSPSPSPEPVVPSPSPSQVPAPSPSPEAPSPSPSPQPPSPSPSPAPLPEPSPSTSPAPSPSPSPDPTNTSSPSPSPTAPSPSPSPTPEPTNTSSPSPSPEPFRSPSPQPTNASSPSPSPEPASSPSPVPINISSPSPSPEHANISSPSPSPEPLPVESPSPSPKPTNTSSPSPSSEPTNTSSPSPAPLPVESPSPSPEPTNTTSPGPSPDTNTSSPSPSPEPDTNATSPSPSPEPSPEPSPSPSPEPGCELEAVTTIVGTKTGDATCSFDNGVPANVACIGRSKDTDTNCPPGGLELFIAVDQGNKDIYYSDSYESIVRKIDGTTGLISTIAGQLGTPEFNADGIPANFSVLAGPQGVTVHKGLIYITDSWNHRIRVIRQDGLIYTVAGNDNDVFADPFVPEEGVLATATQLNAPYGSVVFDSADNMYFVDSVKGAGRMVRKVDASTGVISTVVNRNNTEGDSSGDNGPAVDAVLVNARSLAVLPDNSLLIADSDASRIRRVDLATGNITTLVNEAGAKTGLPETGQTAAAATILGPSALSVGQDGFYFADNAARTFWKVAPNPDTQELTLYQVAGQSGVSTSPTDGPVLSAVLGYVESSAVGPDGTIYLAQPFPLSDKPGPDNPLIHAIRNLSKATFSPCPIQAARVSAKSLRLQDERRDALLARVQAEGWPWPGAHPVAIRPPRTHD